MASEFSPRWGASIREGYCKASVWENHANYQCSKSATKDGWCGIHHPDAEKRRRDRWKAKYEAERKADNEKYERQTYDRAAGEWCRSKGMKIEELTERR